MGDPMMLPGEFSGGVHRFYGRLTAHGLCVARERGGAHVARHRSTQTPEEMYLGADSCVIARSQVRQEV